MHLIPRDNWSRSIRMSVYTSYHFLVKYLREATECIVSAWSSNTSTHPADCDRSAEESHGPVLCLLLSDERLDKT